MDEQKTATTDLAKADSAEQRLIEASFSGPLPPPKMLAGYEAAHKGAADRIIRMAEEQAAHRREMEKLTVATGVRNETMGMYFAFILTLLLMGFGSFLVFQGKEGVGFLAFFVPVVFHAGNYLYQRREKEKSEEKQAADEKE